MSERRTVKCLDLWTVCSEVALQNIRGEEKVCESSPDEGETSGLFKRNGETAADPQPQKRHQRVEQSLHTAKGATSNLTHLRDGVMKELKDIQGPGISYFTREKH